MTALSDICLDPRLEAGELLDEYLNCRYFSTQLAYPLSAEDQTVQSMPDASPTKWHLAHTSWFFETFILEKHYPDYRAFNPDYRYLFNSYYQGVGPQYTRAMRGVISRPGVSEVLDYREYVDSHISHLMQSCEAKTWLMISPLIRLGIEHEKQHQELLLTDIKHAFSLNPSYPAYANADWEPSDQPREVLWSQFEAGLYNVGADGDGFAFDNESPRHKVYLNGFSLANQLVTNQEYQAFIRYGGYKRPEFWLSEGWDWVQANTRQQPLYWCQHQGQAMVFSLHGLLPLLPHQPVCHLSYYEADAFARWRGKRLPTEHEWEVAAMSVKQQLSYVKSGTVLHPAQHLNEGLNQMFNQVWQWTSSGYSPYPGFKSAHGALGEYNGKFMCNQMVLRGGSVVTPSHHVRTSYRNFFPPQAQWQFTGVRLAEDLE